MILTVHIDNRVISLGCYEKAELLVSSSIAVNPLGTADQYAAEIQQVLRFRGIDTDAIDGAVISSVVPALTSRLKQAADHLINGGKTLTVGAGIKTGLDIRWDSAASVGSDFICNAVAALREFTPPLVVVHFAGATTFTAIDTALWLENPSCRALRNRWRIFAKVRHSFQRCRSRRKRLFSGAALRMRSVPACSMERPAL